MTANRNSSYRRQATLARLLAILIWILLASLLVLPSTSLAQSSDEKAALLEYQRLVADAKTLLSAGKFSETESIRRQALLIVEKISEPIRGVAASVIYFALAEVYQTQDKLDQAEPLLRRVLEINENSLVPENRLLVAALSSLGSLYLMQRRLAQAEPLLQRALALAEKILGAEGRVAQTLENLAEIYRLLGQYAQAETLLRRALAIYEKILGPGSLDARRDGSCTTPSS